MPNDLEIACLSKDFKEKDLKGAYKLTTPLDYLSYDIDTLIINEAALASRLWADKIQDLNKDLIFKYKAINLKIPAIHLMGIGYYPETFFQSVIRGYRYTETILNELKPQKIILIENNAPVFLGSKIAIDKLRDIMNFSIEYHKVDRRSTIFKKGIKSLLQLGRDVYCVVKNSIWTRRQKSNEKQKILYFPIFYNRIRLVEPVLKELIKKNYSVKLIINSKGKYKFSPTLTVDHSGKIHQTVNNARLVSSIFDEYLYISNLFQLLKRKAYFGNYKVVKSVQNNFGDGLSMIVNNTFEEATNYYMYNCYYGLIRSVEILGSIIEIESPKLLLFNTDEASIGKLAALIGQKMQIPVVNMDHGLQYDAPRISDLLFTKMAVSGSLNKEVFIKNGAKEKQLEITGMPIHDSIYYKLSEPVNIRLLKELGLNPENRNILLLTHPENRFGPEQIRKQILRCMFQSIEKLPRVNLIIKPHPNETDGLVQSEVAKSFLDNVAVIDPIEVLYDIIHLCNVAVTTFNSTSSIEAVLFGKPVLIINFTGNINTNNCAREGVAIEIKETEKVYESLDGLLHNKDLLSSLQNKRKKFIVKYAYKLDGKSSERVADLTQGLIESQNNIHY